MLTALLKLSATAAFAGAVVAQQCTQDLGNGVHGTSRPFIDNAKVPQRQNPSLTLPPCFSCQFPERFLRILSSLFSTVSPTPDQGA